MPAASRVDRFMTRVCLVLGTAMVSLSAFLLTDARCGAVAVTGTIRWRSRYCRALGAPALLTTPGSIAWVAALFLAPTIIAVFGTVAGRERWRRASGPVAIGLAAATLVLVALADSTDWSSAD